MLVAQYEEHTRSSTGARSKTAGSGWEGEVMTHVQALRNALRADHEAWIAEVQQWADDAQAAGDTERVRRHLAHVARLKAMPYPWEKEPRAA
jgi:hypothetical protein